MSAARLVIYGATGYTGELIAREAVRRGLRPMLAGRSEATVAALAQELGCEYRIASLEDPGALDRALQGAAVTMHCAGPFSATSAPMVAACLRQRSHYLDITGEIDVLEAVHERDAAARQAGVVLCPATGFDVVPTDCVAARLRIHLRRRNSVEAFRRLTVAFANLGPEVAGPAADRIGLQEREASRAILLPDLEFGFLFEQPDQDRRIQVHVFFDHGLHQLRRDRLVGLGVGGERDIVAVAAGHQRTGARKGSRCQ